jgi:predicted methyltransferase
MHGLNNDGATPSQIFELTQNTEKKDEFSLAYTNNVLGKLKVRKLVENKNGDYYLTDKGINFAETIK